MGEEEHEKTREWRKKARKCLLSCDQRQLVKDSLADTLMIPHTSETNSEDDDHLFICCLWPHYCHSALGHEWGPGVRERKRPSHREE